MSAVTELELFQRSEILTFYTPSLPINYFGFVLFELSKRRAFEAVVSGVERSPLPIYDGVKFKWIVALFADFCFHMLVLCNITITQYQ